MRNLDLRLAVDNLTLNIEKIREAITAYYDAGDNQSEQYTAAKQVTELMMGACDCSLDIIESMPPW